MYYVSIIITRIHCRMSKAQEAFYIGLENFFNFEFFYSVKEYLNYRHLIYIYWYKKELIFVIILLSTCFWQRTCNCFIQSCFHSIITCFISTCHMADWWINGMCVCMFIFPSSQSPQNLPELVLKWLKHVRVNSNSNVMHLCTVLVISTKW